MNFYKTSMLRAKYLRNMFLMSTINKANPHPDVLVLDAFPIDIMIYEPPEEKLEKSISNRLKTPYLSICDKTLEQINMQRHYKGAIVGVQRRLFVSIPTSIPQSNRFINVHYMLDLTKQRTSLSLKAICALQGKQYSEENQKDDYFQDILIGGIMTETQLSNPPDKDKNQRFSRANILGMNFFRLSKEAKLNINFACYSFDLDLLNRY